jgi:hypothetical protein
VLRKFPIIIIFKTEVTLIELKAEKARYRERATKHVAPARFNRKVAKRNGVKNQLDPRPCNSTMEK